MNMLKSILWDLPTLCEHDELVEYLKNNHDNSAFRWLMSRFLERGRYVDVTSYFNLQEIGKNIGMLRISDYSRKKWERFLEVYGQH